jgi:hypothetical protein
MDPSPLLLHHYVMTYAPTFQTALGSPESGAQLLIEGITLMKRAVLFVYISAMTLVFVKQGYTDDDIIVRLAVQRYFQVNNKLLNDDEKVNRAFPWTVLQVGNENEILASMKCASLTNSINRIVVVQSLLNRQMESFAFECADRVLLTRQERERCMLRLQRQPSEDVCKRILRLNGQQEGEDDTVIAIILFLGRYERFAKSLDQANERRAMHDDAVKLVPLITVILADKSMGDEVVESALMGACCCRAILQDTELNDQLEQLIANNIEGYPSLINRCAIRGWRLAVEAGCASIPDELAVKLWKDAFAATLQVGLTIKTSIARNPSHLSPKLDALRTSMASLINCITEGKLTGRDSVAAILEQISDDQILLDLLFAFEASRLFRNPELLRIANDELEIRLDRNSIASEKDKLRLTIAAAESSSRMGGQPRPIKAISSCLELLNPAEEEPEWVGILSEYDCALSFEVRLALASGPDPETIRRVIELTMVRQSRHEAQLQTLGALWAVDGADVSVLRRIREKFPLHSDLEQFVCGLGRAMGAGQSEPNGSELWGIGEREGLFADQNLIVYLLMGIADCKARGTEPSWRKGLEVSLKRRPLE